MTFTKKLAKLADKFEAKLLKEGQVVSQSGTTELFFGTDDKQRAFNAAIQKGAVANFLTITATKTQQTASFDLKMNATPHKGAAWILQVVPPTLQGTIYKLLDTDFTKIVGQSMVGAQKLADAGAKAGKGSGTLQVGSFSADVD